MDCGVRNGLVRVRKMVELTDNPFLLYLIDVAIIQAEALAANESLFTLDLGSEEQGGWSLARTDASLAF